MDFNMNSDFFYTLMINLTVTLMILILSTLVIEQVALVSARTAAFYEADEDDLEINDILNVSVQFQDTLLRKLLVNTFFRLASDQFLRENTKFSSLNACHSYMYQTFSTTLTAWEQLTSTIDVTNFHDRAMLSASLYPSVLSCVRLPDELTNSHRLFGSFNLNRGTRYLTGQWFTSHELYTEVYDDAKTSVHTTGLEWDDSSTEEGLSQMGERGLLFETKSVMFMLNDHLVLVSRNELTVRKADFYSRQVLLDARQRRYTLNEGKRQSQIVYRSPFIVFVRPLEDSSSSMTATDRQNLLESASSFSTIMQIIIVTLLLEITKRGLHASRLS